MSNTSASSDRSNLKLLSKSTPLKTSSFQQSGSSLGMLSPPVPSKSSITPNKAANLSHVPCKFFKQGACTAGTNCTFSHNPTPTSEASVCKYFIKGNCKFGAKCALLHTMSPYGDGRKYLSNRINANGGSSLLQQRQQQYSQDSFHDTPLSQSTRYHHTNGFSQLTAAIQQHDQHYQQQQQQQNSQTPIPSTPTSNSLTHYLQQNASLKHHHGITGLRTSSSIWDTPTNQSYDQRHDSNGSLHTNNSSNSIFGGGHLQQIPETFGVGNGFNSKARTDAMMDPDDIFPSSSTALGHSSHDQRTRLSSRFFQHSGGSDADYSQKLPLHSQSYTFQGQPSSSLQGSYDRFGGIAGNSIGDTNDIWNGTHRFSSSFSSSYHDLKSAHAINIPGGRYQQTTPLNDDVDLTCHFTRHPHIPNQHQQDTSFYTNTPEPSFITPPTVGSYQQQRPTAMTPLGQHEDNDVPFFMDDADDVHIQQDTADGSLGQVSFTSLVRPTY